MAVPLKVSVAPCGTSGGLEGGFEDDHITLPLAATCKVDDPADTTIVAEGDLTETVIVVDIYSSIASLTEKGFVYQKGSYQPRTTMVEGVAMVAVPPVTALIAT